MKKLVQNCDETSKIVRFANKMVGFYGHPVYLVGSHLISENPRDVDILGIVPDEDFKIRWFPNWYRENSKEEIEEFYLGIHTGIHKDEHWKYYADMMKQSFLGIKATYLPIDFKVQAQSYSDSHFLEKPKLRLDTRPY